MANKLTQGFLESVNNGNHDADSKPLLQVLGLKKVKNEAAADRYRVLLSDGRHTHSSSMLATQLNVKVDSGEIANNAVIRLEKFLVNSIGNDRKILIVLNVAVLQRGSEVNQKLGNPVPLTAKSNENVPPRDAQPAPQAQKSVAASAPLPKPSLSSRPSAPKPAASNSQSPNTPGGSLRVHPISSLTPYQNRWQIRARVTQKSDIRTWSNSRGTGRLFSCNLLDESAEIRATGFNEEVDKFFEMLQVGKVYYVSRATLKTANKQYSSVANDYEMTFNRDTQITPCDDAADMPEVKFNFTKISQLEACEPNSQADILGIVFNAGEVSRITTKSSGREISKRDLQLVDESTCIVRCTVWGETAEKFDSEGNPVLAMKGVRVSDFGGRSLSVLGSSTMMRDPDLPEAHRLRGWFEREGRHAQFSEFSRADGGAAGGGTSAWKTFLAVKSENLGHGDKPDYYTVKGTVMSLKKENCLYQACPTEDCNKKVIDQGNGSFRCEKCMREFPNFKWRLILQANLADFTDNLWVTCFQDVAESILGKTAQQVGELRSDPGAEVQYDDLFAEAAFKSFQFRLRSKMENYNDEMRLKTIVVGVQPVNCSEYAERLQSELDELAKAGYC